MYFMSYLIDVLNMTNFFALPPQNFNTAKPYVLNRFTESPRDNFKFGAILNYFTFCLTDNLAMTNFFTLTPNV